MEEQLEQLHVQKIIDFNYQVRNFRCTSCNGDLRMVPLEIIREKVPERTQKYITEYYQCSSCQHIFWEGAHWKNINARLARISQKVTDGQDLASDIL